MEKLIEAWRKQAIREDQQAKECFEEGCEVCSQGHSSEAEIYRKCADELQRHLTSRRSRAADSCAKGGKHEWGIDGMHSNEFCKKCFISAASLTRR